MDRPVLSDGRDVRRKVSGPSKRDERIAAYIMLGLFFPVLFLTYALPDDSLARFPILGSIVQMVGSLIPSVGRFGVLSAFPDVAQIVYVFELLLIPFIALLYIRWFTFDVSAMSRAVLRAIVGIPLPILLVLAFLVYLPGTPDGSAWTSRLSRQLVGSKLGFALWSTLISFGMAGFLAVSLSWTKYVVSLLLKARKGFGPF